MNKYEMLKEIAEKIDYKSKYTINTKDFKWIYENINWSFEEISIQEFIFNQKFMTRFADEIDMTDDEIIELFDIHLDNPIKYLYNLIK